MSSKNNNTTTTDKAKPTLVPKLRFPEFRETQAWSERRLIDTVDRSVKWGFIGGPFGSNLKSSDYVPSGVRIIQLQNIGDGEFHNEYQIFTTEEKADELLSNNIFPGEIIMSKMGDPVGRACLIPEGHDRYVMCSDGIRLVVNPREHDKYFIYSLINSPLFRTVVEKTATGSTRKRIGLDELKSLPMRLPKKAEQQKIAECLSSVDELIAAQARKVDALKTHKKGLMQRLFPREGETQPRLRFPEFQNAGEWEPDTLESLCTAKISYGIVQAGPHVPNGMPYIKSTDLNSELCLTKLARTSDSIALKYQRSEVMPGDIVFSLRGNIGATQIVPRDIPVANLTQGTARIRPKGSVEFYIQALQSPAIRNRIISVSKGSTIQEISLETLRKVKLPHPKIDEQRCIAACLTRLDALITAEDQKLEALKTHKKGLMQQLFPSSREAEA
ncbi:restriction endonuclease subunit S [Chromobacterium violaceum]|uniref:Type I restriction modification DNA specificity domain-containing protein n=1 Tax=Chromobacterium violaceum TaxID=536 RepID=A0A202BER2_CHRVL|nr:restriction endonuclease subunit S [Chromobacterium violaceum]OVE50016.1 hypothetical protein CBW21_01825 [Chromobacterium violaceum]